MSKTVWGQMLVKNEDKFIYFAATSLIKHLDKLLIWDTGSTDKTLEIIQLLKKEYPKKISFQSFEDINSDGITKLRQKMLDETESDWFILLDGDEVWWDDCAEKVISEIKNDEKNLYALVNPVINLVGDIYHYQEEAAGEYKILGKKGHFNVRAINRQIKGLHLKNSYPLEGYYDSQDKLIQQVDDKIKLIDAPILHFTHLIRSSNINNTNVLHRNKYKYELGIKFLKDFKYPEVFYRDFPIIIDNPFERSNLYYKIRASIETPLKKIKRRIR